MQFYVWTRQTLGSLLVILLLFNVRSLPGQSGDLRFNHLQVKNGLSEATNAYVYKDSRGFVWISSTEGLNRFDGTQVKTYFPDPDDPCAIVGINIQSNFFEDDSSRICFNTHDAVNVYDWKSDCFHGYQIHVGQDSLNGLIGYISFYLDKHHNLWMLCNLELYTFNLSTSTFKKIGNTDNPSIRGIVLADAEGKVTHFWTYWPNVPGAEEFTLDTNLQVIDHKMLWDSASSQPLVVRDMVTQGDSLLWVLSDHSLWKYNVLKKKSQLIPLDKRDAMSFEFMNDSTMLIGFNTTGLWEFNISKAAFTAQYLHQPEDEFSLASNSVNDITKDMSGGIWVSSWGTGLSYAQVQKKKFNTFYPKNLYPGIQPFVPASWIPDQPETLICATKSNGFYYLHRKGPLQVEITKVPNLDAHAVQGNVGKMIRDDLGHIWILTFPGFSVFDPVSGKIRHVSNVANIALDGLPWRNQEMLLSGRGLFETTGNVKDGYSLKWNPAIPDSTNGLSLFLDSRGRLWFQEELSDFLVLDTMENKPLDTLPITGLCSQIVERNGTIWICSTDGLFEVDAGNLQLRKVHQKNNGMPASGFNSMVMDLDRRLWLTFNQGIVMFDPSTDSIRTFTQADGLPSLQFTPVAYQFDDGEIWFAAIDAVTRFYPDQIHDLTLEAIPQITEIQVNDKVPEEKLICELTGATNIPLIEKLTFDYKRNTLAFRINALEYSSPQNNKLKYQMEGLDEQWIKTSSGSLIRYPNIQPGNYRLVVYASNSDGVYNPRPRILLICITPPYYKTWWFITLMILAGGSLLAYIMYLRFSKTLELQRVRLKLYENLHDDIGSRLTAIVLSAEDLERNENIQHPKIQAISKIAKNIVGNMRRLVWAIDPENDKVRSLIQKITHDKSLILADNMEFHVEIDEHLKNVIIPGEIRYQISSICNEAFNNISKYARATRVTVKLSRDNRKFYLTISDNGIGFDPSATSKNMVTGSGYGLNNMKKRASRVKGSLNIFSKPGEGTSIEADFPY